MGGSRKQVVATGYCSGAKISGYSKMLDGVYASWPATKWYKAPHMRI